MPCSGKTACGELDIDKWSPTQWELSVTNCALRTTASIVLDKDALDELIATLKRIQGGAIPSAKISVDKLGGSPPGW